MAVATLGAWIINELNSLLTQQKLNLEESRLLDCNILETSEGLAAIAAAYVLLDIDRVMR